MVTLPAVTTSTEEALIPVSSPRPSRIRRRMRSPRLLRNTRRMVTLGESATMRMLGSPKKSRRICASASMPRLWPRSNSAWLKSVPMRRA